jgi:hypothetical protein
MMEYGTDEDRNRVFASCVGKVMQMSHDKFASNIIENVLKKGTLREKVRIYRYFIEENIIREKKRERGRIKRKNVRKMRSRDE